MYIYDLLLLTFMLAGHSQLFSPPELYLLPHWDMSQRSRWYSGGHATQKEGLLRAVMQARSCTAEDSAELVGRLESAAQATGDSAIAVGGGVAANSELRRALPEARFAPLALCTDNAAMIASAARFAPPLRSPGYLALDAYASSL